MLEKLLSYIPAATGIIILGLFVLLNNPKRKMNRYFFIFNLSIFVWLLTLFFADISVSEAVAIWLLRFALFSGTFVFLAFLYFSFCFPSDTRISKNVKIFLSAPLVIAALLSFTPAAIGSVEITEFGAQPKDIGLIYTLTDILSILYIVIGIIFILAKYKKYNSPQKLQTKIFISGLSIAVLANIFTGFIFTHLNINSSATYLGGFSLLIFSCFMAYAIVKHKLFDVRLIVARALAYTLLVGTLSAVYTIAVFGIANRLLGSESVIAQQVVPIIAAVVLVFTAPFFKKLFDKITNKFFYQDAYDPQELMDELNQVLISNMELSILLRRASEVIQKHIKTVRCVVAVHESEGRPLRIAGTEKMSLTVSGSAHFAHEMNKIHQPIIMTDELGGSHSKLRKVLRDADMALAVKMRSGVDGSENLAYLLLGPKQSGNMYGRRDIKTIEIIADSMVIAIQNALRFEEIQGFAATLQERVDEATAKLKRTNDKLKELDETKDEFISMASHQLRTPLTSVKGYLSMVLEGDMGKVDPKQKKLLDQAFTSSQRMVYLIADLLNVSRLKTGKFVIVPTPTDLAEMVQSEINQLVQAAKAKDIKLAYKKPTKLTLLNIDETKMRQVVMNFADNAIYYTPGGGKIDIEVREDTNNIYFTVKDNGIGIPKDEQAKLFGKFFRATNAKSVRPDGTGLGLFMAKKVVSAQGGSIIFESEVGKGSTFGFCFSKAKLQANNNL